MNPYMNLSPGLPDANDRLRDAAPELLETLQNILPLAEKYYRTLPDDGAAQDYLRPQLDAAHAVIAKATA